MSKLDKKLKKLQKKYGVELTPTSITRMGTIRMCRGLVDDYVRELVNENQYDKARAVHHVAQTLQRLERW